MILTYGGHGGGKCALQLRQVLDGLKMRPIATMPELTLSDAMIRGVPVDPAVDFAAHTDVVRQALRELLACLPPITTG